MFNVTYDLLIVTLRKSEKSPQIGSMIIKRIAFKNDVSCDWISRNQRVDFYKLRNFSWTFSCSIRDGHEILRSAPKHILIEDFLLAKSWFQLFHFFLHLE